ncbi:hypothetical protein, partial [Pseudomonas sp. FW305-3-2-15-E-TSA4]|uniref:hypothetical protein n=1 Tax=Pseudomonas sp. FW305-3-2-15-E-TSA4 TaxID=2259621 RepID=UPI000CD39809
LDRFVTLLNNRALTVYLWHNLLLVPVWVLLGLLHGVEALGEGVPRLLGSPLTAFALLWGLLAVVCPAVGWVEDVAARRPVRWWPDGRRS